MTQSFNEYWAKVAGNGDETSPSTLEAAKMPEDVMQAVQSAWEQAWSKTGNTNAESIRDAIAKAILAERERSQWQPIETAPKDGTTIFIAAYCEEISTVGEAYWPEAEEWFWWHSQEYPLSDNGFEAKFWQPLPTAPKEKAARQRPCTCHPDDNPPVPCAKRYALTECRAAVVQPMGVDTGAIDALNHQFMAALDSVGGEA